MRVEDRFPQAPEISSQPSSPGEPRPFRSALDVELVSDPFAGAEIGSSEVLSCLVEGRAGTLVALQRPPGQSSRWVVLRRLPEGAQEEPSVIANAELAQKLEHPNLEKTFGIELAEEGAFWVSELISGATLAELQAACKRERLPLPMGFALGAVNDALKALQKIHANPESFSAPRRSAYGLVRPQNIVVGFSGRASLLNPQFLPWPPGSTVDMQPLAGNAGYLSPEAIRGEPLDPRSDVFSIAILLHELLTGQPLFRGHTPKDRAQATLKGNVPAPSRVNVSLNSLLDAVIAKALHPQPAQRYANAAELTAAFQQTAGEHMWREAQRAQLMQRLFSPRSERLKFLAGPKQEELDAKYATRRRAKEEALQVERAAAEREAEKVRVETQRVESERQRAAQAHIPIGVTPTTGSTPTVALLRSNHTTRIIVVATLVLALAGAAAVGAWWATSRNAPPPVAAPIPAPAPVVVQPPASTPPPREAAVETPVPVEAKDGELPAAVEPQPKPKPKKKKTSDVPPWLR